MKKAVFILGLAVGYVLGARQGREGYERLKERATDLWRNPRVRNGVRNVQNTVAEKAPAARGAVNSIVKTADRQVTAATPAEDLHGNV